MKQYHAFELYVPHLTKAQAFWCPNEFEQYKNDLGAMLLVMRKSLTPENILDRTGLLSLDEAQQAHPQRFFQMENTSDKWFDAQEDFLIEPTNLFYDLFFAYKLRQLDLKHIIYFLKFQLQNHYENKYLIFHNYLKTLLMKYRDEILDENRCELVEDFMKMLEQSPGGSSQGTIRHKVKRLPDDKLTALNQELTALFIYILQEGKGILKDEYLNNTEAGECFSKLTGYSADTLRQKLGKEQIERLSTAKNLTEVDHFLTRLKILVEHLIRESKTRTGKS